MDKTAIRTYAVEARRKLIEAVKLKAQQLYIFEDSAKTLRPGAESERLQADGIFLSYEQLKARERLYTELLHEDIPYKPAIYNRVMENVACTWFNRLVALRIMEVNNWLPSNIRILSSHEPGRAEPDAMREVERLDFVSQSKIAELRADTNINASEKLYKYILISQCNALSKILPGMFEKEDDYTELLLPDALLSKGGIVNELVNRIGEDNFNVEKQGQIEIIGWLYQFYISEKKDEVFAGLKKNIKINKDTIPAATQLFTPEWIVKYMVENSLGRLWLDNHPNDVLRAKWKYYVDEAEQEPQVAEQLRVLRSQSPVKRPEDIKLIDPCMGSGHILVYAFDVLFQIYQSEGYSEREIPNLILQNNIYGLDIDDRAGQLAYFALMIKARSYNRRFFRQDNIPQPMVYAFLDRKWFIAGLEKWLGVSMNESDRKANFEDLLYLAGVLGDENGKTMGSALKIERKIDFERLRNYIHDYASEQITLEDTDFVQQAEYFDHLIDVARLLAQKYDVVVTNPPYMAPAPSQVDWVKENYPDSKSDMFSIFIEKCLQMTTLYGYSSLVTMQNWMFISSFETLRKKLLANHTISTAIHIGFNSFPELNSKFALAAAFVIQKKKVKEYIGCYFDLNNNYSTSANKEDAFYAEVNSPHLCSAEKFSKIPGNPLAYWVNDSVANAYVKGHKITNYVDTFQGIITGDNDKFLRYWFEVNGGKIPFHANSMSSIDLRKQYWIPYNKGGEFRKWYGLQDYVVYWKYGSKDKTRGKQGFSQYYLREYVAWSYTIIDSIATRYYPQGFLWDVRGSGIMDKSGNLYYLQGLISSKIGITYIRIKSSVLSCQVENIIELPIIVEQKDIVDKFVKQNIEISRIDWDSFETSWDFQTHPLVSLHKYATTHHPDECKNTIHQAFGTWMVQTIRQFETLKKNETELNRIFIEIYGLQDELTPEVEDKDVTVRKADLGRDIRSFLSYAVGCMFGRYSLDEPGLVFAGGTFNMSQYKIYLPEDDNIIPIGSTDYFDDDIVVRFVEFVRKVYGDSTLNENLNFIADALYPNANGSAQERIRRYFLNDFYKDHVKIYQKRPIYWLMDSGKKDGFKALFYLHRYDKYTVARARTDYLHPLQRKYEAEIRRLEMLSGSIENAREKAVYRKEIDVLLSKIDECRVYDQVVSHIAHQQIELDLDDGVKVNYEKFQGVDVPKDNGKTEIMDLLGKI